MSEAAGFIKLKLKHSTSILNLVSCKDSDANR
jgi:hypothetical protein